MSVACGDAGLLRHLSVEFTRRSASAVPSNLPMCGTGCLLLMVRWDSMSAGSRYLTAHRFQVYKYMIFWCQVKIYDNLGPSENTVAPGCVAP